MLIFKLTECYNVIDEDWDFRANGKNAFRFSLFTRF